MIRWLFLFLSLSASAVAETALLPIEQNVQEKTQSSKVTVVHFWAPWCPNCKAELANGGWSSFIASHPDVQFIFITTWNDKIGTDVLRQNGVGSEPNFTSILHPNASRLRASKMTTFLGLPVSWIPTTWIFKDGKLRYAMNYGELHFPMLNQLLTDSSASWDH